MNNNTGTFEIQSWTFTMLKADLLESSWRTQWIPKSPTKYTTVYYSEWECNMCAIMTRNGRAISESDKHFTFIFKAFFEI